MGEILEVLPAMESAGKWVAIPLWVLLVWRVFVQVFGEKEARGVLKGIGSQVARTRRHMIAADRSDELEEELDRLDAKLKEAKELHTEYEKVVSSQHRYIIYITREIRRVELWATERGIVLPPPPLQAYTQWTKMKHDPKD